jgi:hypothetical protein
VSIYNLGHAFIMWGFYALGCVFVALLVLAGLMFLLGFIADRRARRGAHKTDAGICPQPDSCSYPHCDCGRRARP